jgi:hypothetical protein
MVPSLPLPTPSSSSRSLECVLIGDNDSITDMMKTIALQYDQCGQTPHQRAAYLPFIRCYIIACMRSLFTQLTTQTSTSTLVRPPIAARSIPPRWYQFDNLQPRERLIHLCPGQVPLPHLLTRTYIDDRVKEGKWRLTDTVADTIHTLANNTTMMGSSMLTYLRGYDASPIFGHLYSFVDELDKV